MEPATQKLWAKQNQHEGDRERLFRAVADVAAFERVLYPGSYVDVAASMAFADVVYVDSDNRAPKFFDDESGVREILGGIGEQARFRFIHADYTSDLGLADDSFDLLVSLYAGFISEHCTRYLRVGGTLLVNPSHGDAAMASIDDRYELSGVVISRSGTYRVHGADLESYLIPKKDQQITVDLLHELGRGIGYTKSPFAYLFTRVR